MSIQTGVSSSLLAPQNFHVFNLLRAGGKLTNVPLRVALIGAMRSSGATAVAGTVYDMSGLTPQDGDNLFGAGSELALMHRQSIACASLFGSGPRVFCVPVAESAGVANVQTITCVGTATTDSNQIIRVSGRTFVVGVSNGTTQNSNATAISNALKARASELPVIVTVATNVVTLTHATKGANGADVKVTVDQQVTGIVATVATGTAGTSVTDHQPALDALSPLRYDGIVFANHASADVTEVLADIAIRWGAASKTWAQYFMGEPGTIGTGTVLSAAGNDKALNVASFEGCMNTAGEMATTYAMMVFSRERPNASYNGVKVPLYPPATATIYTPTEVETALAAGLTPFVAVLDSTGSVTQNRAKCVRAVTTHTTQNSNPDDKVRDIGITRTIIAIAVQLEIESDARFGPDANPDGVRASDVPGLVKKMWAAIARAEARDKVLDPDQVEADIAATVVEADLVVAGRFNTAIFYHYNGSLHQIAWQHNVTVP